MTMMYCGIPKRSHTPFPVDLPKIYTKNKILYIPYFTSCYFIIISITIKCLTFNQSPCKTLLGMYKVNSFPVKDQS